MISDFFEKTELTFDRKDSKDLFLKKFQDLFPDSDKRT